MIVILSHFLDEVKLVLAKAALPQVLWSLLEKYRSLAVDDETRELKKIACDLIALVLTGGLLLRFKLIMSLY